MAPTPTPTPIPTLAPRGRPDEEDEDESGEEDDGDVPDPGLPAAGGTLLGLTGNDENPCVAEAVGLPPDPDPGAAPEDVGCDPDDVVLGRSEAWKLIWIKGAKRTKLDCILPLMVRGKDRSEKSLYEPLLHWTVEKAAEVTVRTQVWPYVLSVSMPEQEKPVGQQAAAVSPELSGYTMLQPVDPPYVAMAAVVKPAGQTTPGE